jgi:hypothetical protein
VDAELAVQFWIGVAKDFRSGECHLYDGKVSDLLVAQYGSMERLQSRVAGYRG